MTNANVFAGFATPHAEVPASAGYFESCMPASRIIAGIVGLRRNLGILRFLAQAVEE
jgi:hypothetical protein